MNHLLFYIITAGAMLTLVVGSILWWLRRRGYRIQRTKEELETEDVLRKAFGKDMKWGYPGSAQDDVDSYHRHADSDGGGADASD